MARIVLIADDSPTIQKRALGILKGQGFEVETVSNGVAAIKRLAVLHPVVVLADVSMPGRDGYEVCEFVKKSPEHSHVPVLLVASDMEPYDGPRGEQVGADGIIKKPFEARDLISIVEKFADQFEATTIAVPVALPTPTAKPESTGEFPAFGEERDGAPTLVQHVAPDFSAHAEGMAFAEPAGEEAPGFSYETHPHDGTREQFNSPLADEASFPESVFEPPRPLAEDQPLAAESSAAPIPVAPSLAPPDPQQAPSFPEVLEAAMPDPVFLEEQHTHAPEPLHHSLEPRTMIFRTPLEIAEPVWTDETAPIAPAPLSDGPMAVEPRYEAEAPVASPENPLEQPSEPARIPSVVTATSLDSFSLDDAATGQVHFASEGSEVAHEEVVYSTSAEEVPTTEIAPPAVAPEVVYAETTRLEVSPEAVHTEAAPSEVAPEVVYSTMSPHEALAETVHPEITPSDVVPEVVYAETTPLESAPEMISTEASLPEGAPEVPSTGTAVTDPALETVDEHVAPIEPIRELVESESASPEPVPESVRSLIGLPEPTPEATHSEIGLPGMVPEAVLTEIALLDAHTEAIHSKIADAETSEVIPIGIAPEESVPEVIHAHDAMPDAIPPVAPTEPPAEVDTPPPAVDLDSFYYSIIRKVVVRMSPPVLSAEVVEEIARRLAEEIAAEISSQSSQSPT